MVMLKCYRGLSKGSMLLSQRSGSDCCMAGIREVWLPYEIQGSHMIGRQQPYEMQGGHMWNGPGPCPVKWA